MPLYEQGIAIYNHEVADQQARERWQYGRIRLALAYALTGRSADADTMLTALAAEAKPIASWFNLRRMLPERGFPVYRNQHVALVVAGVGKTNAAAATAYLYARSGCPADAIWVNVGVAGHPSLFRGCHAVAQAAC